ncbi:MAG: hypothetical protein IT330_14615, partial [Anaerolineae bacterium]|nr:hypothetical protein [Anaerolineae bacterium]
AIVVPARWPDGLTGEVRLSLYEGRRGFVLSGQVPSRPAPVVVDRLGLFRWTLPRSQAGGWRLLINSGHQGYSGSVGLAERIEELPFSQDVTVLRGPQASLALGNVTLKRTNAFFQRSLSTEDEVVVTAFLAYGGMSLPAGQPLALESVLLYPDNEPLHALEAWADSVVEMVRPRFSRSRVGLYNQWYANWTPESDFGSAALILQGAEQIMASGLIPYGVSYLGSGVWHNRAAFGEEEPWPGLFPQGIGQAREQVQARGMGFMHGGFFSKASSCATLFREHPERMARDDAGAPAKIADESWGACRYPYYVPDITLPQVQDWLRQVWQKIHAASTGYHWLDFFGAGTGIDLNLEHPRRIYFADPSCSFPFETDRLNVQVIRQAVGDDAIIGTYTSSTFNLIGLVDRVRLALDVGGLDHLDAARGDAGTGNVAAREKADRRWHHVEAVARNMAANYFCHNRFWVNDPDPAMVGIHDRADTVEEARVRLMIVANSGGFVTVGEPPDKMHPRRLALLKTLLPVYGEAARPLDLLDREVAQVYDLAVCTHWDRWHVVTLFNWGNVAASHTVLLAALGLGGPHHVYELWERRYLGVAGEAFEAMVPPRSCRVFCVRAARPYPWLLSTDLHVTQGGVEASAVAWDAERMAVSGRAFRHDGEGNLWLSVPAGFQARAGGEAALTPLAGGVVGLPLKFAGTEVEWEVQFVRDGA